MSFSLSAAYDSIEAYLNDRAPNQDEFHQAVIEVMRDVKPIIDHNEEYKNANVFERLVEPERVISFQVAWETDDGAIEVNRGYRVQFNSAIGPYKGGLRFHPTVNQSVLKFLGFEQTFKNALTGLPMGGAKGGSDFDPHGRSEREIMRFCNAFMGELHRHIAPDIDVPAGDINVGAREIGYLFGAYRRITNQYQGVLTGKGLSYGGSPMRVEATGYGVLYFLEAMLNRRDDSVEGKSVIISGAGNVATHAATQANAMGARVVSLSDSRGFLHDPEGLSEEQIDLIRTFKRDTGGSLEECCQQVGAEWSAGKAPWGLEADIALPCATQNELDEDAAQALVRNGVRVVVEGANMPTTPKAREVFEAADVLFAPGKAANAGGVAVSGLEISQNRQRRVSERDAVAADLRSIMIDIHAQCVEEGLREGVVDYSKGANIAAFRKVADAMVAQGIG